MRNLKQVLENDFELDLTGWDLTTAWGVTTGQSITVVGEGFNPSGDLEGWIAVMGSETPEEQVQNVSDELQAVIASTPGSPLADKLEDANAKVDTALVELAKSPPDEIAALGEIEGAIGDIQAAVASGVLDPSTGNDLLDNLEGIAKQFADDAIEDAIARGADVTTATQKLSEGVTARAAGDFKTAVAKYKDTITAAQEAPPLPP